MAVTENNVAPTLGSLLDLRTERLRPPRCILVEGLQDARPRTGGLDDLVQEIVREAYRTLPAKGQVGRPKKIR